jgi:hypothetical protein
MPNLTPTAAAKKADFWKKNHPPNRKTFQVETSQE